MTILGVLSQQEPSENFATHSLSGQLDHMPDKLKKLKIVSALDKNELHESPSQRAFSPSTRLNADDGLNTSDSHQLKIIMTDGKVHLACI